MQKVSKIGGMVKIDAKMGRSVGGVLRARERVREREQTRGVEQNVRKKVTGADGWMQVGYEIAPGVIN